MKSSSNYHHGSLREALLLEASRVLEADGADAVSLRALARSLDVSHAAPSYHFGGRNELLAELAADGYRSLSEALDVAMAGVSDSERTAAAGRAYVRYALAHPERYRLMFASKLMLGDCPARLSAEAGKAYLALLRAAGQEDRMADPPTYRMGTPELEVWSRVHGAVMLWLDGQLAQLDGESEFLGLVDAVLDDS